MSEGAFFEEKARKRVAAAVEHIEATSSAEVVVAVRARSWRYRHTHYLVGFVCSLALLAALLFLPQSFDIDFWPVEVTLAFVVGVGICVALPPVERWLTANTVMRQQVQRAAKAEFVDLGVSRTRDRSGLLIYVSLGERQAALVGDIGLEEALSDSGFEKARNAIVSAASNADFEAFEKALRALAKPLEKTMPRREDDINELPDEVA